MSDHDTTAAPSAADRTGTSNAEALATLVARWHFESFHGTRLANDTELWNLVHAATGDLSSRLAAFMKEM
jgi:hypothetical protein